MDSTNVDTQSLKGKNLDFSATNVPVCIIKTPYLFILQFEPGAVFKSLFHHKETFNYILCIFQSRALYNPLFSPFTDITMYIVGLEKKQDADHTIISMSRTSGFMYSIHPYSL